MPNVLTYDLGGTLSWHERRLRQLELSLSGAEAAVLLWGQVLKPDERSALGGDVRRAFQSYGPSFVHWQLARGGTRHQALVATAVALGYLNPERGKLLLEAAGEEPAPNPDRGVRLAVASGALVLCEIPRSAYWEKEPIPADWRCKRIAPGRSCGNSPRRPRRVGGSITSRSPRGTPRWGRGRTASRL